jgi:hypothetical protein
MIIARNLFFGKVPFAFNFARRADRPSPPDGSLHNSIYMLSIPINQIYQSFRHSNGYPPKHLPPFWRACTLAI